MLEHGLQHPVVGGNQHIVLPLPDKRAEVLYKLLMVDVRRSDISALGNSVRCNPGTRGKTSDIHFYAAATEGTSNRHHNTRDRSQDQNGAVHKTPTEYLLRLKG